jgi:CHAD domain-containing protein
MSEQLETEVKLGAWPGFELPSIDDAVPGLRAEGGTAATLEATYFDAPDLRLIRAGISLRHRTGEDNGGPGIWTLKLPAAPTGDDGAMHRLEHTVAGGPGPVPTELVVGVRPWLRTADLGVVAHLQTVRRAVALVVDDLETGEGHRVGSIDDDEVSVLASGRVAARFREVEVEVGDGAPAELLPAVVERLRTAGAGAPDPTPKLVRALGPRALQPADLSPVELRKGATAGEVLRVAITTSVLRMVEHDAVIRADQQPEGIHQARVGSRRLRSDLRTFGPLLEEAWAEPLRDELRWFAGELGEVRDRDVLGARLRRQVAGLPETDRAAADAVIARLDRERSRAFAKVIAVLDGRRYLALLDRLVDAANAPRTLPAADAPATDVVPQLAGDAYSKLRKAVKGLGKAPTDEELHELRIKAKRSRYAADVAIPVVGDRARDFTKALAALQDVLGDHHDCSVAADWLSTAAGSATRTQAFAVGQLVAEQRHEAERLRGQWRKAWEAVDRSKLTRWMG